MAFASVDEGRAQVHVQLIDGTYELFRQHYGRPSHLDARGREVAAVRGVLADVLQMIEGGATHLGVATDHVIESFRNELWSGYKTSAGMPAELLAQIPMLEDALSSLGVVVWPMVELEADDALASAAAVACSDSSVDQVRILTPDKDLAQCVSGQRVVQVDRRRKKQQESSAQGSAPSARTRPPEEAILDEEAVKERFGIPPSSIPDWLALVGDSADGFPGLKGWGPRSASAVLGLYGHLEDIPTAPGRWEVTLRNGPRLAAVLAEELEEAMLFRRLATLVREPSILARTQDLRWKGPDPGFGSLCAAIDARGLERRAQEAASIATT